jgi:CBS domain containing-hemolysin-like protein
METKDIITIVVAILSSGAFSAVVNAIIEARREKKQKETGASAGIRMLLYDRIKHLGKSYIARGSVSAEELEDLISMHRIYHDDLGGNGFLDALMGSVKSLQIKK